MAQSTVTIASTCKYKAGGGSSWTTGSSYIYSGVSSSSNYRSCLTLTTGDWTIASSNYMLVSITIDSTSSPAGCYGVLSTNGNLTPSQTVSDTYYGSYTNGPHPDYLASGCTGYIAESDTYTTSACTTLVSGYNQSSGYTFYFKFNSSAIKPNTTYYLYIMRYIKSGDSTSSGWTRGKVSAATATLDYVNTYNIDVNMYRGDEGTWYYSGDGINKFHADIGGTRVTTSANDLGYAAAPGTAYTITPVAATGYTYMGTQGGSAVSGTYPSSDFSVNLRFDKNYVKIAYGPQNGIVTASGYYIDQWGWISNGTNAFHTIYYGNNANPYNATAFGLIRPGYTFNQWNLNYTSTNLDQDTDYASTVYANGSSTTANSTNFYTHLLANWTPNTYTITLDPNGGSITSTSQNVTYSNGAYTSLPIPTNSGKKFAGWFADIGNNGPINLGLDYKYDSASGIGVYFQAYMDDWSSVGTATLISCTNGGGWNLWFNSGNLISEVWDSTNSAYTTVDVGVTGSDLSSGWHTFGIAISESLGIIITVDGEWTGQASLNSLGYYSNNALWLGAEASANTTSYDGYVFPGLIRNFTIENKYTGIVNTLGGFAIPCQNITLYADWESAPYMYVKVDGVWRLGQAGIKLGSSWVGIDSIECAGGTIELINQSSSYPFWVIEDNTTNNRSITNTNQGKDGTSSICSIKLNVTSPGPLYFNYQISTELGCDIAYVSAIDESFTWDEFIYSHELSGEDGGSINLGYIDVGEHTIDIAYGKDGSISEGADGLQFNFTGFKLPSMGWHPNVSYPTSDIIDSEGLFTFDLIDGYYQNTNQYMEDQGIESVCYAKIYFYSDTEQHIIFNCYQCSEASYDYAVFSEIDTMLPYEYVDVESEIDGVYTHLKDMDYDIYNDGEPLNIAIEYTIPKGYHYITVKYQKDSSVDNGDDTFKFMIMQ